MGANPDTPPLVRSVANTERGRYNIFRCTVLSDQLIDLDLFDETAGDLRGWFKLYPNQFMTDKNLISPE
jgi:hypothetical protein